MQGGESAEYFDSGRDGDDYGGGGKIGSGVDVYSYSEHVVGSDDKSQEANG